VPLGRLGFARWRSDVPSGGNRYDDELAAGLLRLGLDVREYPVAGRWPVPDEAARRGFTKTLTAERDWLVDNILAAGAPEAISGATAAGRRVAVLVHYFPADELGWTPAARDRVAAAEAAAVTAAHTVIANSGWTAAQIAARYGRSDSVVAVPGVAPAPLSPGSAAGQPPRLLWLGRLTRTKDPLTLVKALDRLADLDWTARVVGPDTIDHPFTREVRAAAADAGLTDRVGLTGARTGSDLELEWTAADLLVLTSRVEPYGMVVTEALARGIPSLVTAGTGAVEAQRVGGLFRPGDAGELAEVLRSWLTQPAQRRDWREAALSQRRALPTWDQTAESVLRRLDG
jgi:glycosyltransferase involved in cell wall biosynthesis